MYNRSNGINELHSYWETGSMYDSFHDLNGKEAAFGSYEICHIPTLKLKELAAANKQFACITNCDNTLKTYWGGACLHLFTKLTNFITANL